MHSENQEVMVTVPRVDSWAACKGKDKHQSSGFESLCMTSVLGIFRAGTEKAVSNLNLLLKIYEYKFK